eukprot:COSAG05_NODE_2111_length_3547_cov_3.036833_3_plen_88_part_00
MLLWLLLLGTMLHAPMAVRLAARQSWQRSTALQLAEPYHFCLGVCRAPPGPVTVATNSLAAILRGAATITHGAELLEKTIPTSADHK